MFRNLFRRHYRQLIEAVLLDAELLPKWAWNAAPMPGQAARDLAAIASPIDFCEFYSDGVLRHDTIRQPEHQRNPRSRGAGIAVHLSHREPGIVHVNYWNTNHPLMEAVGKATSSRTTAQSVSRLTLCTEIPSGRLRILSGHADDKWLEHSELSNRGSWYFFYLPDWVGNPTQLDGRVFRPTPSTSATCSSH